MEQLLRDSVVPQSRPRLSQAAREAAQAAEESLAPLAGVTGGNSLSLLIRLQNEKRTAVTKIFLVGGAKRFEDLNLGRLETTPIAWAVAKPWLQQYAATVR